MNHSDVCAALNSMPVRYFGIAFAFHWLHPIQMVQSLRLNPPIQWCHRSFRNIQHLNADDSDAGWVVARVVVLIAIVQAAAPVDIVAGGIVVAGGGIADVGMVVDDDDIAVADDIAAPVDIVAGGGIVVAGIVIVVVFVVAVAAVPVAAAVPVVAAVLAVADIAAAVSVAVVAMHLCSSFVWMQSLAYVSGAPVVYLVLNFSNPFSGHAYSLSMYRKCRFSRTVAAVIVIFVVMVCDPCVWLAPDAHVRTADVASMN